MEVRLTEEEKEVLKWILEEIVIKDRTGAIGIMHGADRFVSMSFTMRKPSRIVLNSVYRKFGLANGIKEI